MISKLDENKASIFVWLKKKKTFKIFKLCLSEKAKESIIHLFNNRLASFFNDENNNSKKEISFDCNYKLELSDEIFVVDDFEIPQELKEALESTDCLDSYKPSDNRGQAKDGYEICGIIVGEKIEKGLYFIGQRFTQKQVLIKSGINLFYTKNTFKNFKTDFVLNIRDKIDFGYDGKKLYFESFNEVKCIFDMDVYIKEATEEQIGKFLQKDFIECQDFEKAKNSLKGNSFFRQKVSKIIALGTLNDFIKIKDAAKKNNMDYIISSDGNKLIFPDEKAKLKEMLAFLAEEIYIGWYTNDVYISNSTMKVK